MSNKHILQIVDTATNIIFGASKIQPNQIGFLSNNNYEMINRQGNDFYYHAPNKKYNSDTATYTYLDQECDECNSMTGYRLNNVSFITSAILGLASQYHYSQNSVQNLVFDDGDLISYDDDPVWVY